MLTSKPFSTVLSIACASMLYVHWGVVCCTRSECLECVVGGLRLISLGAQKSMFLGQRVGLHIDRRVN